MVEAHGFAGDIILWFGRLARVWIGGIASILFLLTGMWSLTTPSDALVVIAA